MYEQMRNEFIANCRGLKQTVLEKVLKALDETMIDYEVTAKTKALTVANKEELPQLVQVYLACKIVSGQSKGTIKNARSTLKHLFDDTGKAPGEMTTNDIRMWLFKYKQETNVSERTLDKYRMYISSFFEWAKNEEYISKNPASKVSKIKYEAKQREALNQIELEYLRKVCKTPREVCILEVLYSTGCRVSELVEIKLSDIDFTQNTVHVFGKGKKHRTVYLNAKALVAIKDYLSKRKGDSEYLITSDYYPYHNIKSGAVETIFRDLTTRAGYSGRRVTPHVMRHTMATLGLNAGMEISTVSKILGHESINTTLIYATMNDANVQAQHEKYVI